MPMVTVEHQAGRLSALQKADLAEGLTKVLLDIEGGGDTPFGRASSWVRFREIPADDWFVGGLNDRTHVSDSGLFLVEIYLPEGLLDQDRISRAHHATNEAIARVTGGGAAQGATASVWVQVFEWPEEHMAAGGRTSGLFRTTKRPGHPADHPVLTFPRAYFAAKDRAHKSGNFPEKASGRALDRY